MPGDAEQEDTAADISCGVSSSFAERNPDILECTHDYAKEDIRISHPGPMQEICRAGYYHEVSPMGISI